MDFELADNALRYDNDAQSLELILKVDTFESVNSMYGINRRTGAVYLLPGPRKFKSMIHEQITYIDPIKYCGDWITYEGVYSASYSFILRYEFWKRDVDNMIKMTQDAICECLHINDSHIVELSGNKLFKPGSSEYLIFKFRRSNLNYMQLN